MHLPVLPGLYIIYALCGGLLFGILVMFVRVGEKCNKKQFLASRRRLIDRKKQENLFSLLGLLPINKINKRRNIQTKPRVIFIINPGIFPMMETTGMPLYQIQNDIHWSSYSCGYFLLTGDIFIDEGFLVGFEFSNNLLLHCYQAVNLFLF